VSLFSSSEQYFALLCRTLHTTTTQQLHARWYHTAWVIARSRTPPHPMSRKEHDPCRLGKVVLCEAELIRCWRSTVAERFECCQCITPLASRSSRLTCFWICMSNTWSSSTFIEGPKISTSQAMCVHRSRRIADRLPEELSAAYQHTGFDRFLATMNGLLVLRWCLNARVDTQTPEDPW